MFFFDKDVEHVLLRFVEFLVPKNTLVWFLRALRHYCHTSKPLFNVPDLLCICVGLFFGRAVP